MRKSPSFQSIARTTYSAEGKTAPFIYCSSNLVECLKNLEDKRPHRQISKANETQYTKEFLPTLQAQCFETPILCSFQDKAQPSSVFAEVSERLGFNKKWGSLKVHLIDLCEYTQFLYTLTKPSSPPIPEFNKNLIRVKRKTMHDLRSF